MYILSGNRAPSFFYAFGVLYDGGDETCIPDKPFKFPIG